MNQSLVSQRHQLISPIKITEDGQDSLAAASQSPIEEVSFEQSQPSELQLPVLSTINYTRNSQKKVPVPIVPMASSMASTDNQQEKKLGLKRVSSKISYRKPQIFSKHQIRSYLGAQGDVKLLEKSTEVGEDSQLEDLGIDYLVFSQGDLDEAEQQESLDQSQFGDASSPDHTKKYNEQRKVFLVRLRSVRNLCIAVSAFLFFDSLKYVSHAFERKEEVHNWIEDASFLVQLILSLFTLTFFLLSIKYEARLIKLVHVVMVVVILQQIALQSMHTILKGHIQKTEELFHDGEEGHDEVGHEEDHLDLHDDHHDDDHDEHDDPSKSVLDYHDDHDHNEVPSLSLQSMTIQLMQYTALLTIGVYCLMFYNHRHVKYVASVLVTLNALALITSQNLADDPLRESEIVNLALWFIGSNLFLMGCFRFFLAIATQANTHVRKMADYREDFKIIFENLEESLLIISNDQIDYVNDYFLKLFRGILTTILCAKELSAFSPDAGSADPREFIDQPIFKEYRSETQIGSADELLHQTFSIKELTSMSADVLKAKTFIFLDGDSNSAEQEQQSSSFSETLVYLKVKLTQFRRKGNLKSILQFIDVSNDIKQTQYKAQNELLSMINACVSHELRNPLNSIIAQNIEKYSLYQRLEGKLLEFKRRVSAQTKIDPLAKKQFEFFKGILRQLSEGHKIQESSADLMIFMVQDLLDYAQIKAGKFRKMTSRFDIREAVDRVMCIQRKKACDQGLGFTAHYHNIASLQPEEIEDHFQQNYSLRRMKEGHREVFSPVILSDENRIKQVLLGLQSNALKFTQKGKVEIHVRIHDVEGEVFLEISVIDTGIGIKREDQGKLFQLFGFVQDSQQLNTKGIGLGLVIADQIVNQYGGSVSFKSEPGVGSTFTFSFKLHDSKDSESVVEASTDLVNANTLLFKWKPKQSQNLFESRLAKSLYSSRSGKSSFSCCQGTGLKYVHDLNLRPVSHAGSQERRRSLEEEKQPDVTDDLTPVFTQNTGFNSPRRQSMSQHLSLPSDNEDEIVLPTQLAHPILSGLEGEDSSESDAEEVSPSELFLNSKSRASTMKPKILIVDDQSFNIDALRIIMQHKLGLADADDILEVALGGQEAIDLVVQDASNFGFEASSYTLILMDCNMPFVDGCQATQEIRQFLYGHSIVQPIISAVTGHSDQSYAEKAIKCGMNQVLSKPVPADQLKDLLLKLCFKCSLLPK